jgi:hypothetical protein
MWSSSRDQGVRGAPLDAPRSACAARSRPIYSAGPRDLRRRGVHNRTYNCRPPDAGCRPKEKRMSSVVKKRRKKMRKHKHRKMLKKTRWQRKHK